MYIKITKHFLHKFSKDHIISSFSLPSEIHKNTKKQIIDKIIEEYSSHPEIGSLTPWFFICPFCRIEIKIFTSAIDNRKPKFCVKCGKTSPLHTLEKNLQNTESLLTLASKMNLKTERDVKSVLIEQGLVTVITSLEVLMRQTYSLIYDLKHVVFGNPIYIDTYPKTRSDFLNLGAATVQIKKVVSLNLKKEIDKERYNFLARMYSSRHIIIHNSSIKDKEFVNQTNSTDDDIGKPLKLTIPEVRRAKSIAVEISKKLDWKLREIILDYQKQKTSIEIKLRK